MLGAVAVTWKWFGWPGTTSRLKLNGTIQKEWITSAETRLNRTVSCSGISSSGIWPSLPGITPFQVGPTSQTSACPHSALAPLTRYCGYWKDQLHWNPVTFTTTAGCAERVSIWFSSRAVKKNSTPTMMNGTTVYMISIGRLYRTWRGTRSERLRWKITVHTIRPQTSTPTIRAAIHEPCHRSTMVLPCVVTGARRPRLVHASFDEQPAVTVTRPMTRAVRGSQRRSWPALTP